VEVPPTEAEIKEATDFPLCANCLSGHVIPGTPAGEVKKFGGVDCYITPPHKGEQKPGKVVVLLTDIFGLGLVNNKLVADLIANEGGYTVYVPDLFDGYPVPFEGIPVKDTPAPTSFFQKIKLLATFGPLLPFMIRNRQSVVEPRVRGVLQELRNTEGVEKIGITGYCFGGKYSILFGPTELVDVVVAVHPSMTTPADIGNVGKPFLFLGAEEDMFFDENSVKEAQKLLEEKDMPCYFKVYPGTVHGFGARPNFGIPEVKIAFEDAHKETVAHFNKYL